MVPPELQESNFSNAPKFVPFEVAPSYPAVKTKQPVSEGPVQPANISNLPKVVFARAKLALGCVSAAFPHR
jgi:hypothetical protein